jgi:ATP-dependent RNA helicase HelY
VFATETLAVGINMPARSVVIEKLTKMREHGRSALTSGEYAQLTGRAGRRGLDTLGHGLVVWNPHVSAVEVSNLAVAPPANLQSSFRPTYNLAVNLVQRYPETDSRKILDSSFAQFLERRHGEALSRRFDRILKLLRRWGYVDAHAWKLTGRGALLTRLYHDADLLVAEALVSGMFDHLDAPCTAAMVSLCTFESRSGQWRPEPTLPRQIHRRVERIGGLSERLQHDEEHLQLARTRHPDHGFADAAWRWARGEKLSTLLERVEMTPGDFVRSSKQLIDLLRQISLVAPVPATAVAAADAVSVLHRGVVAAGPPVVGDAPGAATNKIGSATGPSSRS